MDVGHKHNSMQYSIVNGEKIEAKPNLRGTCLCCNQPTYSACGKINTWHWRHENSKMCDSWWEHETDWHREWKENFPTEWREVVHFDEVTNEKHIADIKTKNGVVLEFQNSPMSSNELNSREVFYKKLIWVVNASNFQKQFKVGNKLPDPESEFPKYLEFLDCRHNLVYNNQNISKGSPSQLVQILDSYNGVSITRLIDRYYTRHHKFEWRNPRKVWYNATAPIFFDFNDGLLWRIQAEKRFPKFHVAKRYSKQEFISHYNK